jgi:hypothetical protein
VDVSPGEAAEAQLESSSSPARRLGSGPWRLYPEVQRTAEAVSWHERWIDRSR